MKRIFLSVFSFLFTDERIEPRRGAYVECDRSKQVGAYLSRLVLTVEGRQDAKVRLEFVHPCTDPTRAQLVQDKVNSNIQFALLDSLQGLGRFEVVMPLRHGCTCLEASYKLPLKRLQHNAALVICWNVMFALLGENISHYFQPEHFIYGQSVMVGKNRTPLEHHWLAEFMRQRPSNIIE